MEWTFLWEKKGKELQQISQFNEIVTELQSLFAQVYPFLLIMHALLFSGVSSLPAQDSPSVPENQASKRRHDDSTSSMPETQPSKRTKEHPSSSLSSDSILCMYDCIFLLCFWDIVPTWILLHMTRHTFSCFKGSTSNLHLCEFYFREYYMNNFIQKEKAYKEGNWDVAAYITQVKSF